MLRPCQLCSTPAWGSDFGYRVFRAHLCEDCYASSKRNNHLVAALACARCSTRYPAGTNCPRCLVHDRVGADMFECDCGAVVDTADSVRMMRKVTGRIERVCNACSRRPTCPAEQHHLVTPQHKDWDPARYEFQPIPETLIPGYCSVCDLPQRWDGARWTRMTWAALAEAWERVDA